MATMGERAHIIIPVSSKLGKTPTAPNTAIWPGTEKSKEGVR